MVRAVRLTLQRPSGKCRECFFVPAFAKYESFIQIIHPQLRYCTHWTPYRRDPRHYRKIMAFQRAIAFVEKTRPLTHESIGLISVASAAIGYASHSYLSSPKFSDKAMPEMLSSLNQNISDDTLKTEVGNLKAEVAHEKSALDSSVLSRSALYGEPNLCSNNAIKTVDAG